MIIRKKPDEKTLKAIYETINRLIKDEDCYYTHEELERLKEERGNRFIENA